MTMDQMDICNMLQGTPPLAKWQTRSILQLGRQRWQERWSVRAPNSAPQNTGNLLESPSGSTHSD